MVSHLGADHKHTTPAAGVTVRAIAVNGINGTDITKYGKLYPAARSRLEDHSIAYLAD